MKGIDKQLVGQTRRRDPQGPPARAVQGQGHPLRGRARPPQGREARMSADRHAKRACGATAACAARSPGTAERPRLAVFRSNRGIYAQLIDDVERQDARGGAAGTTAKKSFKGKKTEQAVEVGKLLAAAAKKAGVESAVFDRARLPLPRPRQGARRRARAREDSSFERRAISGEPRAQGARGRDQPRREGRQGRPALLVHRARRDRRRARPGRRRLRQGARGPARDLEGGRRREEEHVHGAEARARRSRTT